MNAWNEYFCLKRRISLTVTLKAVRSWSKGRAEKTLQHWDEFCANEPHNLEGVTAAYERRKTSGTGDDVLALVGTTNLRFHQAKNKMQESRKNDHQKSLMLTRVQCPCDEMGRISVKKIKRHFMLQWTFFLKTPISCQSFEVVSSKNLRLESVLRVT